MHLNLAHSLCAAALAVVVASGSVAAQTIPPTSGPHVPLKPLRNLDGSIKRGPRNEIVTGYWSGYAVTAAAPYTSASGTFQVPAIRNDGATGQTEWESQWVGIGGYFDSTLIQLGVNGDVSPSGGAYYYPWYELIPAGTQVLSHPVKPGDIITVSLQCTAECLPSQMQTWQLTMTDETAGWSWTQSVQYQSSMVSAQWILEAPWLNGELPLADFGQATFDPVEANGVNPNVTVSANGIQMSDPWGETSNPSDPVGGNVFSTCWGLAPSYTACTAGSFTPPQPTTTVSLSAYPTKISPGQASTLTWDSANASSCAGAGFAASGTFGSAVVYPIVTTAYSVTCAGTGGSATALATVTVSSSSGSGGPPHGKKK
jgi:hypothetical protein